jgi:hypothetical protein
MVNPSLSALIVIPKLDFQPTLTPVSLSHPENFFKQFARFTQSSLLNCHLTDRTSTVGFRLTLVLFRKNQ